MIRGESGRLTAARLSVPVAFALASMLIACGGGARSGPPPEGDAAATAPSTAGTPLPPPGTEGANPFGLMPGSPGMTAVQRVKLAQYLGAAYLRPFDVTVEGWKGACADRACGIARAAGLGLVLTVRNNGGEGSPTTPAKDLEAYARTVGAIIDAERPAVLVVENEENSALFWDGSPREYGVELKAACDAAHLRGVRCANGGLVSEAVMLLVWASYADSGDVPKACDFARRAAVQPGDGQQLCAAGSAAGLPPRLRDQLDRGRALLALYAPSGADYVNFHWYAPDAGALGEAVAYLRQATGLPAMTNEWGLRAQDPDAVRALMAKMLELRLPVAVAFSIDRQAQAFTDPDGTPRPNGDAYRAFTADR